MPDKKQSEEFASVSFHEALKEGKELFICDADAIEYANLRWKGTKKDDAYRFIIDSIQHGV